MPITILRTNEIDLSHIKITQPQQNKNGGLNANLLYKDQRLVFRTPKMPCPFGVSSWSDKDGRSPPKFSLDMSFRNMQQNPEVQGFHDFLKGIDDKVIAAATANSQAWFGKPKGQAILRELYSPSIRESTPKQGRDGNPIQWPPTFRCKVVSGQMGFNSTAYDVADKPVEILSVGKGDSVIAIVEVTGIYFINRSSFGVSYRVIQCKVFQSTRIVGSIIDCTPDEIGPSAAIAEIPEDTAGDGANGGHAADDVEEPEDQE